MSNNINLEDQVSELNPIQFKHFKEVYTSEHITKYELELNTEEKCCMWEDFKKELFNKRLPSFYIVEPKEDPDDFFKIGLVIAKGQELVFKHAIESINYAFRSMYSHYIMSVRTHAQ